MCQFPLSCGPARPHDEHLVHLKVLPKLLNGKVDLNALGVQAAEVASEPLVEVVLLIGHPTSIYVESIDSE